MKATDNCCGTSSGQGYTQDDLTAVVDQLPMVFELIAFTAWNMPNTSLNPSGSTSRPHGSRFDGLMLLGLTRDHISELNTIICGTQTIGAPGLLDEHLRSSTVPTVRPNGKRYIAPSATSE